tara:strand:- start:580 stop:1017 length:438 start_codon:yes stop_codon:yes gene_type:complete
VFGEARLDLSLQGYKTLNMGMDDMDKDTLAVLENDIGKIRFITADQDALGAEDFKVLFWDKTNMVIGLSDAYVSEVLDLVIVDQVIEEVEDLGLEDKSQERNLIKNIATTKLAEALETILEIVRFEANPSESSIDQVLEDILDEN